MQIVAVVVLIDAAAVVAVVVVVVVVEDATFLPCPFQWRHFNNIFPFKQ